MGGKQGGRKSGKGQPLFNLKEEAGTAVSRARTLIRPLSIPLSLHPYLHKSPIRQLEVIGKSRAWHVGVPGAILLISQATIGTVTAGVDEDADPYLVSDCEGCYLLPHGLDQTDDLVAGDLGGGEQGTKRGGEAKANIDEIYKQTIAEFSPSFAHE